MKRMQFRNGIGSSSVHDWTVAVHLGKSDRVKHQRQGVSIRTWTEDTLSSLATALALMAPEGLVCESLQG